MIESKDPLAVFNPPENNKTQRENAGVVVFLKKCPIRGFEGYWDLYRRDNGKKIEVCGGNGGNGGVSGVFHSVEAYEKRAGHRWLLPFTEQPVIGECVCPSKELWNTGHRTNCSVPRYRSQLRR
jgi:hypothetical protein